MASGLPTTSVLFAGFLPPKSTARRRRLAALGAATATVVLYVPPHKLKSTLEARGRKSARMPVETNLLALRSLTRRTLLTPQEAAEVIGKERRCCVAREVITRL